MVIGLTGGIASGKTAASNILKELGAIIVDADEIAHQIYRPGEKSYQAIIEEFGKEMIGEDGRIDRDRLGKVVFGDKR
ncbi:MAG: dephospho-CoA kinase, partial [Bacillota bacterium]